MDKRNRTLETWAYVIIWLVILALYALGMMRARVTVGLQVDYAEITDHLLSRFLPLGLLFVLNNFVLIPRLLLARHTQLYFISAALALAGLWTYQYFDFMSHFMAESHHFPPHDEAARPRPLIPLPLFLDFTYGLLVIGGNLAIALLFRHLDYTIERERLLKANAESSLSSLKAQINPHFYMNMLNNIHGLIELDPERAQEMVIEMSRLMRYMIYDSARPMMPLQSEIKFIENYLNIMRLRYPVDKVAITSTFPSATASEGVMVPPLLFLVFIENAFKHGISYRHRSYVAISLEVTGGAVRFSCLNSRFVDPAAPSSPGGIGLENVRRRLSLIYGSRASLSTSETSSSYT
ncbi:MAG: histidine kinase, partial [Duncaniella sp.]|nr:histidine kinase [Duncaniella sp.]